MQFRIARTWYRQFEGRGLQNTHLQCASRTLHSSHSLWLEHELQRHLCAYEKSLSSGQPCHLLAGHCLSFSLPVHNNTKHHLDSTTFSKTTLYTEHLFQNLYSRQAALMNRSRTSITRVAETCATPLPHFVSSRTLDQSNVLHLRWRQCVFALDPG